LCAARKISGQILSILEITTTKNYLFETRKIYCGLYFKGYAVLMVKDNVDNLRDTVCRRKNNYYFYFVMYYNLLTKAMLEHPQTF
jgi:hypothetical protein